ncbi:MAG: aminotransferase class III-fold pyridoxal phosphate-dependent enzyme [Proteobacteria bacterium]|nr:aminotransferase class III-fold pyridoxal phosphate-dependent enzyme [Pseudomonadota bacterium]
MYDAPASLSEAELRELDAQYCSWGDTVHYVDQPKFFESCEGSYMFDAQGRAYLDLQMWYSTANFGYRNPRLVEAAHRQLDRMPQVASSHLHREKIELAALIARDMEAKFGAKGRVHFNVGGAQAVDDSLKLVRNVSGGRTRMFAFQGGYHGRTLGASTVTSSYRYRRRFGHFGDTAHFVEFPYAFRGPKGMSKEEYGEKIVADFARLFESDFHAVYDVKAGVSEFAAFYVEPLQGTGGYIVPPPNFFRDLKKVLDQYGVMLVVDEVQMGMYRTGKLWAIEHFGVTPDVMIFGKSVTNGLNPLSGVWAKEEYINPTVFPPGSTHSTFNANPMGTAVALETLRMAMGMDYETSVPEKGAYFLEGLRELQARWPQIGNVDGLGLALRCELCEADGFTPDKALMDRMVAEGLRGELDVDGKKMGLILNVGGYYKNVITLAPCLDITRDEIDLALKLLDALLRRCVQA